MPKPSFALALPPPAPVTLAIANSDLRFPVRRIYTVGRNYASHAAETGLGGPAGPRPGFALRPADCAIQGNELPYPPATRELDPEVELVIAIAKNGRDITMADALDHVFGYAVGLDVIRRDVMRDCIEHQHSWEMSKAFIGGAPMGEIAPLARCGHPSHGAIWLDVNGRRRQSGDLSELVWSPAEIIARLSKFDALAAGDLIFTGTPKGPRPVSRGDHLHASIEGIGELRMTVV